MKFKGLCSRISLVLLLVAPSLHGMTKAPASTLVAVEIPNEKKDDIARILALHAKEIETKLESAFKTAGLVFIPLKASQLHLTLFDAPLSSKDMHELARVTQNGVRDMQQNSFHPISLGIIKRMGNSIVVTITGAGNTAAQNVANTINGGMGGVSLAYEGHISIGRIKLTSQKSGQPTTQADKDEIERILKNNPQLITALTSISLPQVAPFGLYTIYINHGGGKDAKEIASMQIRDIKDNVGTDKSLVKTVDKELK